MNIIENINELINYSKRGILSKEIFKNKKLDITLFCMAEKTEISEHTSTRQGFIYVLEGDGIFNLKGDDIIMRQGVFIVLPSGAVHSLKANKNTSLILVLTAN